MKVDPTKFLSLKIRQGLEPSRFQTRIKQVQTLSWATFSTKMSDLLASLKLCYVKKSNTDRVCFPSSHLQSHRSCCKIRPLSPNQRQVWNVNKIGFFGLGSALKYFAWKVNGDVLMMILGAWYTWTFSSHHHKCKFIKLFQVG